MPLENPSNPYIGTLVPTNPTSTDQKSQGDDHIRLMKSALQDTFTGFAGMVQIRGTETGSGNAYAMTITPNTAAAAYSTGMMVVFEATHANTGAATFQINSLGTVPIVKVDGTPVQANDIPNNSVVHLYYDGTNFLLLSGNDRVSRSGSATLTGTYDFSAATITLPSTQTATTPPAGDNSNRIVTSAFVTSAVLGASVTIPGQTGMGGLAIVTDGNSANWGIGPAALPLMQAGVV